ncbi:MAG: hypothetical protein ABIG56_03235 [Candidatus Omnitrophota bacterium]
MNQRENPLDKSKKTKHQAYPMGFTLLEVLISLLILVVTLGGLSSLVISGKRLAVHRASRGAGGELGKDFLDPLQMDVNEDTWTLSSNCLGNDGSTGCPGAKNIGSGSITWTPIYNINPVLNTDLRRVVLTIQLPNPSE